MWLRDSNVASQAGSTVSDLLQGRLPEYLDQRRASRQFDQMAEEVATRLGPLIDHEYPGLAENEKAASILAVADTFDQARFADSFFLAFDLDPVRLEDYLRTRRVEISKRPDALLNEAGRSLYERLLRESCNYTVEIAVTLPEFTPAALREILQRETALLELARRVLEQLPQGPAPETGEDADLAFETQYRREIARKLDRLELFGVNVSELNRRYALSVAYITLSASLPSRRLGRAQLADASHAGRSAAKVADSSDLMRIDETLSDSMPA